MVLANMMHTVDPAQEILEKVGDLSKLNIFGRNVLVGVYVRPEKTKGGLFLTDNARQEDRYQGKVGLVLKTGPFAFSQADNDWFAGSTISKGDWVFLRPSDGWSVTVNGVLCRMLNDDQIRGQIPHPDYVY